MSIDIRPFTQEDVPLFYAWSQKEHVKKWWFLEGYEEVDKIHEKLQGTTFDAPCIILYQRQPIGYFQYCDLQAMRDEIPEYEDAYPQNVEGTYCFDLFIGEESHLGMGIGSDVVRLFCTRLKEDPRIKRILVDPSADNSPAIRCYEKAGFRPLYKKSDGVCECLIMERIL